MTASVKLVWAQVGAALDAGQFEQTLAWCALPKGYRPINITVMPMS